MQKQMRLNCWTSMQAIAFGTERNGFFWNVCWWNGTERISLERIARGTKRNVCWNGLFLERNGTTYYGTDYLLEPNGMERNGTSLIYTWLNKLPICNFGATFKNKRMRAVPSALTKAVQAQAKLMGKHCQLCRVWQLWCCHCCCHRCCLSLLLC